MTKKQYIESVKTIVVELMKTQNDMSLTEGARVNAHAELVSILNGNDYNAQKMFNIF